MKLSFYALPWFFLFLLITPEIFAEQQKVGVVDMERVLRSVQEGQRAAKALRDIYNSYQRDLDQRQKQLKSLHQQLSQPHSDADRRRFEEQYRRKYRELQELYQRYQQDLERQEARQTMQILQNIRLLIEELRSQQRYAVIVELTNGQPPPRGAHAADDLTDEVIRRYDQRWPVRGP